MNPRAFLALLQAELRTIFRDRLAVFISLVLPLLLLPMVAFPLTAFTPRQAAARCVVEGRPPAIISEALRMTFAKPGVFEPARPDDAASALRSGDVELVIRVVSPGAAAGKTPRPDPSLPRARFRLASVPGVPALEVWYCSDRMRSLRAMRTFRVQFGEALDEMRRQHAANVSPADTGPFLFRTDRLDVATPEQASGAMWGPYAACFLVVLLLTGGSTVAFDRIAGDRERGTLETLLTTAAARLEVVAARQLGAIIFCLVVALMTIAGAAAQIALGVVALPPGIVVHMPPAAVGAFGLLTIAIAAFVAAVLVLTSAWVRTVGEGQVLLFPILVVLGALSLAAAARELPLASAVALAPLSGAAVALRDVAMGQLDWPWIAVALGSTIAGTVLALRLSAMAVSSERLLSPQAIRDGRQRFFARVWLIFALTWGTVVLGAVSFSGAHAQDWRMAFSEAAFLIVVAWAVRHYGLDPREALALRPVRWPVWVAVALLVPSTLLVGVPVWRAATSVFPAPDILWREWMGYASADRAGAWRIYLLIALMPGICEELAFRGLLLFGLHRRFPPARLTLTVAVIFGFFHFSLHRIVHAAFMGVILTALALLSGSVFPGICLHVSYNAIHTWAARNHVDLLALPMWASAAGAAGLVAALWIIWRYRTPYPGLTSGNPGKVWARAR